MSGFVDFGCVEGQFQPFFQTFAAANVYKFKYFNVKLPMLPIKNDSQTVCGYIRKASEIDYTFNMFLRDLTKEESFPEGTYFIQRLISTNKKDFWEESLQRVEFSEEPVLIDPDYVNNTPVVQICMFGPGVTKFAQGETILPNLVFQLNVVKPYSPYAGYVYPYGEPLFGTMKPSDHEEFTNCFYYSQLLVVDYVFLRGSRDAAGYDIMINEIVDNTRDFTCAGEYQDAVIHSFCMKAKYSVDLIFPKFFQHTGEQCHSSVLFMLRSRFAKHGFTLSSPLIEDEMPYSNLKLTLSNMNNFDVVLCVNKSSKENSFPFRCIQMVPGAELSTKLNSFTNRDEKSKFLDVILAENECGRKDKCD